MKILAFFFSFLMCSFPTFENIQSVPNTADIEVMGNKKFAQFLGHFEKSANPLSIDHATLEKYKSISGVNSPIHKKSKKPSNDELKDFLPIARQRKFTRMGGPLVTPLHRFYPDENMVAVTYLVKSRYVNVGFSVQLSLFDLKGNPILKPVEEDNDWSENSIVIARLSPFTTTLSMSNSPNEILRTTFKNNWEKDINEVALSQNTIINYEKEKSEMLSIQSNGKIKIIENLYANVVID